MQVNPDLYRLATELYPAPVFSRSRWRLPSTNDIFADGEIYATLNAAG
jgi:hypothetical protein